MTASVHPASSAGSSEGGSASSDQRRKALRFRELSAGPLLVLPNAWDAGSAAVVVSAGAAAVATTSGGISWALGRGDGQRLGREEMAEAVRRIAATVDVPVTADIEGGYGPGAEAVAATVREVVAAGAVGVNLEDSQRVGGPLFGIEEQADRLRAGRKAADEAGLPELYVNVRTDVFLFGIGEDDRGRMAEVLRRAQVYADAGADGLFVPGLLDLGLLRELCAASPLPVNAMATASGPSVRELAEAGVRRVSLGTAVAQAAYSAAARVAAEALGERGTFGELDGALGFGELNGLFLG